MTDEFNLSDMIHWRVYDNYGIIDHDDVKEFIKRLRKFIQNHLNYERKNCFLGEELLDEIDKLAGDKLK
jgi:hypothetical protein